MQITFKNVFFLHFGGGVEKELVIKHLSVQPCHSSQFFLNPPPSREPSLVTTFKKRNNTNIWKKADIICIFKLPTLPSLFHKVAG